jgi:Cu(I)/Ag(I) efflux system protein CusF
MIRRNLLMTIVAIAATSASSAPALAWNAPQSAEPAVPYAGRVVKVDADAGKMMIEHRPIWRLYMESMTMIFRVRDGAMLTGLTPGDKIRFKVGRADDGFVVTWIENSN